MNKSEAIADLNARVVKIIREFDVVTLNGGDTEYSFNTLIREGNGFKEKHFSIRVVGEGTAAEQAGYVNGSEPPPVLNREAMLKQRLGYLKTLGAVKILDIDKLGVSYAKIKIDNQVKFIAELDGELLVEDGE